MITEDYVSLETAKLLKENGFNGKCSFVVNVISRGVMPVSWPTTNSDIEEETNLIALPTFQMTMKWLREKHRLHIEVVPNPFNFEHQDVQDGWGCNVIHLSDLSYDGNYEFFQRKYSTYEEACESAIKYCLENLI